MMVLATIAIAAFTFECSGAESWHKGKTVHGMGSIDSVVKIGGSWRTFKVKWGSSCAAPRSILVSIGDSTEQLSDLDPTGEATLPVPRGAKTARLRMINGQACSARVEIETAGSEQVLAARIGRVSEGHNAKPVKPGRAPTQATITKGCVTVFDIYSRRLSILSGITAPEPGIEAKIRNACVQPAQVLLRIGYFNSRNVQFGDGIESALVGAGAEYHVYHQATIPYMNRGVLRQAQIIAVDVYPR